MNFTDADECCDCSPRICWNDRSTATSRFLRVFFITIIAATSVIVKRELTRQPLSVKGREFCFYFLRIIEAFSFSPSSFLFWINDHRYWILSSAAFCSFRRFTFFVSDFSELKQNSKIMDANSSVLETNQWNGKVLLLSLHWRRNIIFNLNRPCFSLLKTLIRNHASHEYSFLGIIKLVFNNLRVASKFEFQMSLGVIQQKFRKEKNGLCWPTSLC